MNEIIKYFPNLTNYQISRFELLQPLYSEWNKKINVISRKDIDQLYLKHVLHSLSIAKIQPFMPKAHILDVGTGGGFPGIPLAILFPETAFLLVDSIGKKIKVVQEVINSLKLKNVKARHIRAENVNAEFDFIISRAVTKMDNFAPWVKGKIAKKHHHQIKNGIFYLKGGDLSAELRDFPKSTIYELSTYFSEDFFLTKKVVHLPLKYKPEFN